MHPSSRRLLTRDTYQPIMATRSRNGVIRFPRQRCWMSADLSDLRAQRTSVRIRVDRSLPLVCIHCGKPARHSVVLTFTERNASGILYHLVTAVALTVGSKIVLRAIDRLFRDRRIEPAETTLRVRLPLCDDHCSFRRGYRARIFLAALSVCGALLLVLIYAGSLAGDAAARNSAVLPLGLALAFGLISTALFYGLWNEPALHGKSLTKQRMVLENVCPAFAAAVIERDQKETAGIDSFLEGLPGRKSASA
jgi:hypothetical protein